MLAKLKRRRFMVSLGGRVRQLRHAKGLSLVQLAERTEVSKALISVIENGQSQPTAWPLLQLSRALGVTADWLLTGEAT